MTAAAAYALLEEDERFAGYSSTARALCALAWAAGRPLRPGTAAGDAEVLVLAELYVAHGAGLDVALARARGEPITDADLRGVVRYASSRLAQDRLRPALLERGVRSVRELSRSSVVELARWLFTLPADAPDEQATIAAATALCPEEDSMRVDPADDGPILGGCVNCGAVVAEAGPTIAVLYRITKGKKAGQYEWRPFSPLIELGAYEDKATWEKRQQKPPEEVRQAREGAHLLCRSCTGRARFKLIEWPEVPDEEEFDIP